MKTMMEIIRDLTPLNRNIISDECDRAVDYLCSVLPFRVIRYRSGEDYNGWIIPDSWDLVDARILKEGRLVYDATRTPLCVIALSKPFHGRVSREELRNHLHYDHRYEDAVPYHYRQQFRPWARDWGFCVPRRLFESLEEGPYDVVLETREKPGEMKILEFTHKGITGWTVVFGSNLDHPGVSNDGLAGCVAGIEILRRLQGRKTKLSYRLVLSPGIIGSEYYLGKMEGGEREKILEGVFLEMLGSKTELAFQQSKDGLSNIERCVLNKIRGETLPCRVGPFRSIIINDEYLWEAYGIPMPSLSRFPYPEYHSSMDTPSIISEESLEEAVALLLAAVEDLESTPFVEKQFEGTICLSNPRYDLYMDYGQIAFGERPDEHLKKMRLLMDLVPTLSRLTSIDYVSETLGLPAGVVREYLSRWVAKGLLNIF
jgi:aminopeptidase-like protein